MTGVGAPARPPPTACPPLFKAPAAPPLHGRAAAAVGDAASVSFPPPPQRQCFRVRGDAGRRHPRPWCGGAGRHHVRPSPTPPRRQCSHCRGDAGQPPRHGPMLAHAAPEGGTPQNPSEWL